MNRDEAKERVEKFCDELNVVFRKYFEGKAIVKPQENNFCKTFVIIVECHGTGVSFEYEPTMTTCDECGKQIEKENSFSFRDGSYLCEDCFGIGHMAEGDE